MESPDKESIRLAMELAWRDHHHARDQTWKALQSEVALAVGLIGINWQIQNIYATALVGIIVLIAPYLGVLISLHHRKLEIRKFTHIINCEEALGLHRDDLLPKATTQVPLPLRVTDVFRISVRNTAGFILRMHFAVGVFAAIFVITRIIEYISFK